MLYACCHCKMFKMMNIALFNIICMCLVWIGLWLFIITFSIFQLNLVHHDFQTYFIKHILFAKYNKVGSDTSFSNLRSLLPIIIKDDSSDSYTELTVETTCLCCLRSSMMNNKWKYKVLISNSCSVLYGYRGLVPFFVVEYIVVFNWTKFLPLLVPRRMAPVVASLAFCQFHPTESMWWPCNVLIIISKFPI